MQLNASEKWLRQRVFIDSGAIRCDAVQSPAVLGSHYVAEDGRDRTELVAQWGSDPLVARLRALTGRIAAGLADCRALAPDERVRAPHILSLAFPSAMPECLIERLAAEQVHVAPRLGRMRISPHAYSDEADVDRFVEIFCKLMRQ